jgi:hypothetical protein
MSKINKNKVCYNVNPDPITSIKEYKIDENGKWVLTKIQSKEELNKINNKESEVK